MKSSFWNSLPPAVSSSSSLLFKFVGLFFLTFQPFPPRLEILGEDSQLKRTLKKQNKGDDSGIPIAVSGTKKGTIAGAVALIIGTSIGSGILALPKRTSPAVTRHAGALEFGNCASGSHGLLPSSISLILCWGFLLIEALLLVEINVGLLKKKENRVENENENELEVISIRTMAQETLGELGGTLATLTYVFLGYTSMIAYASKSGEILYHFIKIPESVSGVFFTMVFAILISGGGTRTTDQVNQVLTVCMIGLLVAIEVLAIFYGGWAGFEGNGDWTKVPATIPVMIFSLVYHDLAPVLCAYLGGDIERIRTSVVLGSVVPLAGILIWNAVALGLSSQTEPIIDPLELLMRQRWDGVQIMVEAFSLLAVGTSLLGTLLGFSQFFKEQIKSRTDFGGMVEKWWVNNRTGFTATVMVIGPTLFVSTTVPDVFSAATDIAGGYCMTMLYGVLPPAMAWAMHVEEETDDKKGISRTRLALFGIGLFACGIILEQIFLDLSIV
ncbi:Tryptophan/tyrosine permease [Cynara cardunculus var. scolymus]|uniref:Tryptophan/tyrosine permease n=1 Tax=Cynara cardunculus var. scolymus TaxID=59895 RepID=A0A118K5W2_CYNCS|nr:Tryptophan/tyrosine permease [Cynara cardunculus var. scolymus]